MKVAYIFLTSMAHYILKNMIIPQMERGIHGAEVVGMFFVGDNTFLIQKGNNIGDKIQELHNKNGMIVIGCDQCVVDRMIQDKLIDCAIIACFPTLYGDLAENPPDQVITL